MVSSDSTSIIICNNDTLNSLHIDSIPLNVGKNTITIRLVSPLGLEGKYSINITRQANPDASLSDLTVFANGNKINFAFNPDSLNYSFSITDTVTDFTLHPQVIDISSIILIGTDTLKSDSVYKPVLQDGDNLLTIKIIAPDKIHSRTYTLSVFRRTTLAATITLNGTEISQLFTIEALIYNAVLPPSVTNAELTITPESPNARISVQRSAPSSVTDYNIPVAENDTIEIRIISGDGTDTSTYYIYITRTLYTVKISKTGAAGGSISPSEDMSVDPGNDLTISFINTPDYTISELIINGVSNRNPGSSYTFTNISQSNSLVAVFTDVPRYSLQMSWTDGGTVGPQTIYNIHANDTIDIYAKPSEGYIFAGWSVSDSAHIIETNTQQTKAYLTKGNGIVTAKFIPGIIYVSTTGSDNNNGFSWATAKRTLQAALDVAQTLNPTRSNPVQIWLAQGTYNPTKRSNISEPRSVIFTIPDHVHLYGGFTTEESSPDERQFYFDQKKSIKRLTFYTTLSGDLNNNNENDASDAIRVLSGDTVILDGLTIFSGFNDQLTEPGGVALLGNAVIKNCEFIQNRSVSSGGALTFIPTTQEASINNSLFSMNISEGSGGAIFSDAQCKLSINNSYFYDNSTERNNGGAVSLSCSVELNNCLFDNNTAPSGGALHLHVTALTTAEINRTTFRANTTVDNKDGGGAVFIYGDETNSQCKFTNCVFDQNKITHEGSDIGGGALSVQNINLKLMNCTFYANSIASSFGGALFIRKDPDFGKSTSIVNCIFWENTAPSTGQTPFSQEIHISDYSVPTVSNTCIRGLDNAIYTGQGNFADDPIFEDLSTQPPDLRLKGHSPCIDNGSDIGAPLVDITNKPRDNRPDVGAYEY